MPKITTENKNKSITIRITENDYEAITALAYNDNRTISDYIRLLLIKNIKENIKDENQQN